MSPVEQDTIDCEYLAYFEPKKNHFTRPILYNDFAHSNKGMPQKAFL